MRKYILECAELSFMMAQSTSGSRRYGRWIDMCRTIIYDGSKHEKHWLDILFEEESQMKGQRSHMCRTIIYDGSKHEKHWFDILSEEDEIFFNQNDTELIDLAREIESSIGSTSELVESLVENA